MSVPAESTSNANDTSPVSHQKFFAHFGAYPLVVETKEAILSLPYSKKAAETVTPALRSVRGTNPFKLLLDQGDIVADGALNQIDKFVPSIKTVTYTDLTTPITRPINGTIEGANKVLANVNANIQKNVAAPSAKLAKDAHDKLSSFLHVSNRKGIITSQLDTLVAPFNKTLEGVTDKYFPSTKKVSNQHSSELSRTARIFFNVVFRVQKSSEEIAEPQAPEQS